MTEGRRSAGARSSSAASAERAEPAASAERADVSAAPNPDPTSSRTKPLATVAAIAPTSGAVLAAVSGSMSHSSHVTSTAAPSARTARTAPCAPLITCGGAGPPIESVVAAASATGSHPRRSTRMSSVRPVVVSAARNAISSGPFAISARRSNRSGTSGRSISNHCGLISRSSNGASDASGVDSRAELCRLSDHTVATVPATSTDAASTHAHQRRRRRRGRASRQERPPRREPHAVVERADRDLVPGWLLARLRELRHRGSERVGDLRVRRRGPRLRPPRLGGCRPRATTTPSGAPTRSCRRGDRTRAGPAIRSASPRARGPPVDGARAS